MPQLAAIDKRYRDKGLRLIGVHAQQGSDEEILVPIKKNKLKFSMARSGQSPVEFQGIPYMFVFNGKGELVYHGHTTKGEAEKVIKKEIRSLGAGGGGGDGDSPFGSKPEPAAGPLVAERAWTSADGRSMVATLMAVDAGTGTFKRKDGRTFELALDKLSEADQATIEAAVKKATDDTEKD